MERFGDAAIAIDRDVAARFPIRLPLDDRAQQRPPAGRLANGDRPARRRSGCPRTASRSASPASSAARRAGRSSSRRREILVDEGAPAHFVIMGGGVRPPEYFKTAARPRTLAVTNLLTDEESAIKELVAEKGLEEHFSFLPFTAETGEIYSALDIVTFPNQGVGLGRPVLEAATYGKPVVASGSRDGRRRAAPGRDGPPAGRRHPGGACRRALRAPHRRPGAAQAPRRAPPRSTRARSSTRPATRAPSSASTTSCSGSGCGARRSAAKPPRRG